MSDTDETTNTPAEDPADRAEAAAPAADDVKEQMRRALEAKHDKHGTAAAGTSPTSAPKVDTHAHGKSQRTFRRKSGSA